LDALDTPFLPQVQYDAIVAMVQGNATLIAIVFGFVQGNWSYLQSMRAQLVANITTIAGILNQLDNVLGDQDCDGLADVYEIGNGTNPLRIDTDLDNLGDAFELKIGTDPLDDDSDGDGYIDGVEFTAGIDPLDAADNPTANQATKDSAVTTAITFAAIALGVAGFAIVSLMVVVKKGQKSRASKVPA
jgi:hypothetical protein